MTGDTEVTCMVAEVVALSLNAAILAGAAMGATVVLCRSSWALGRDLVRRVRGAK